MNAAYENKHFSLFGNSWKLRILEKMLYFQNPVKTLQKF